MSSYSYFKQECTKIKDISCIYKVLGALKRALKSHYVSAPATSVEKTLLTQIRSLKFKIENKIDFLCIMSHSWITLHFCARRENGTSMKQLLRMLLFKILSQVLFRGLELWVESWVQIFVFFKSQGPNVSATPLRQWGFRQCLPFCWTLDNTKR